MIGRVEFVRLMFELVVVKYIDHGVQIGGVEKVFKFVRGGGNVGFPSFTPPVIKKHDFVLSQTPTIMHYLGKKIGLYSQDEEAEVQTNSIMSTITDFIGEICQGWDTFTRKEEG